MSAHPHYPTNAEPIAPTGGPAWARHFQFLGGPPCRTCGGPMTHDEVLIFAYDCRCCDNQKPGQPFHRYNQQPADPRYMAPVEAV